MRHAIEDLLEDLQAIHERKTGGEPWVRHHELAHHEAYQQGYREGFLDQLEWTLQALEEILE